MAWQSIIKFTVPIIGVNDMVLSWEPVGWTLKIWIVKHVVVNDNGGAVPHLISGFAGEVADFLSTLAQTKVGAPLVKEPIQIELKGYAGTLVTPDGPFAVNFSGFAWGIPSSGGLVGAYNKTWAKMFNTATVAWQFDPVPNPNVPTVPAKTKYGASFAFPPIELGFRKNIAMPSFPSALRLRGGGAQVGLLDENGFAFDLTDVTEDYRASISGPPSGWHVPGRINLLELGPNGWGAKPLPTNFFKPTPAHLCIVVRVGNKLTYLPFQSLIGAAQAGQPTTAMSKYDDVRAKFEIEGNF
jgi:hypothetical protein